MLIFPVLELFRLAPSSDDDPNDGTTGGSSGAKIYAFIKGFAGGIQLCTPSTR